MQQKEDAPIQFLYGAIIAIIVVNVSIKLTSNEGVLTGNL